MSEAKTVNLTINERIAALKIFDLFKGSLDTLATLLQDVKQFSVAPEEWEAAGRTTEKNADGSENWNWEDTKVLKDIVLQEQTVKYLVEEIKKKSDAGEVTLKDVALAQLNQKLVV